MKIKKIKKAILVCLLLFSPLLFYSQDVTYSGEINLPNANFNSSPARDIIYADDYLYVYTLKNIIIYQQIGYELKQVGSVDFGQLYGRFAPLYFDHILYTADTKFMTFDSVSHIMYFVTPDLNIKYIKTDYLDTIPNTIYQPDDNYPENMSLHASTKLVFDASKERLYWLLRTLDDNIHSFDSYFAVFEKKSNTWTRIYSELEDGQLNNMNLIGCFTFNTNNGDLYVSRKYVIEKWVWNSTDTTYNVIDTIQTPGQQRNSKLLFLGDKNLLMVFPFLLNSFNTQTQYIYQIDTRNFTVNRSLSPSKKILDVMYLPEKEDVILCYADDSFKQIQPLSSHDLAVYHYNSAPDKRVFEISMFKSTNLDNEIDIEEENLNRPFKFTKTLNSKLLLSKKNEIVLLDPFETESYSVSHIYYSRDNFFNCGAADNQGNTYIINAVSSGFEIIDNTFSNIESVKTAYPVFNTLFNPTSRKLYMFNRLAADKTGFYFFDLDTEQQNFFPTEKAIGDMAINPVNNHLIISEYGPDEGEGATIKIYDDSLNLVSKLSYLNHDYPGRIFVAPNNKIYLSLNMHSDEKFPVIKVISAINYSSLATISAGLENYIGAESNTFQSYFCYNPHDESVYATFSPYYQTNVFQPYQTSYNCNLANNIFPFESEPFNNYDGKLIRINKDNMVQRKDIEAPSEIIHAENIIEDNNSDKGLLFINTINGIVIYNCKTDSIISLESDEFKYVFDIEYCPVDHTLLAYAYEQISINNNPDAYFIHIYKIRQDGSYNDIWTKTGVACSISYNKYDGKLYVYYLGDATLMGESNMKVYVIDPLEDQNINPCIVSLPYKSFFPEVKPQTNYPFFDAYNNAYFPNGSNSSVSILNFKANEPIVLDSAVWNWVSFPRTVEHPFTNSIKVVEDNIQPFQIDQAQIYNLPFGESTGSEVYMTYSGNQWDVGGGLENIYNTGGYKLNIDKDNLEERNLYLEGTVITPNTSIPKLYAYTENWVGYWLYESQDVFEALHDILPELYVIKAENWTCVRDDQIQTVHPGWICDENNTIVNYGEMLVLKPYTNIYDFAWDYPYNKINAKKTIAAKHFQYKQTENYTPIILELDSLDNPLEIGVFAANKCVGASKVNSGDKKVVIRAYLNQSIDDKVSFVKFYGENKKDITIEEYYVVNSLTNIPEKRLLNSSERLDVIGVKTKYKNEEVKIVQSDFCCNIYPNPTKKEISVKLFLDRKSKIVFKLMNMEGRSLSDKVKVYERESGISIINITLNELSEAGLKSGIYILNIKTNSININRKLIIK